MVVINQNNMANFKIRKKMNNRIIAGVCSGISHAIGIDPIWIRLTFIILAITAFPWLFLAYFIAALIIPKEEPETETEFKKVYRVKEGSKLGGVCGGLEKVRKISWMVMMVN